MAIDVRRLLKQGLYETQGPLQSIAADLAQIEKVHLESAARRKMLRRVAGLWAIAGLVCGFLAVTTDSRLYNRFGTLPCFIVALALFIHSFAFGRRIIRYSSRREVARKLLAIFEQDADAQASFSIRLSLDSHPKLISEKPWPVRSHGKEKFFEEPWLSIAGRLLDGTILTEEVTEMSRKRTYANARGKAKVKTRCRFLVSLRFSFPKDRYAGVGQAHQALKQPVRVPGATKLRDVRVSGKAIALKALTQTSDQIPKATGMLALGAYRILNLAKRAAR